MGGYDKRSEDVYPTVVKRSRWSRNWQRKEKRAESGVESGEEEDGKGAVGYVGCGWYERGAAYYAVNTVHIGMRAAGEEITISPLPLLSLFQPP